MKGIIALRMCDMSKYGGLPLEYGTVPAPVWRNIHPRLRMGTAARARAGVGLADDAESQLAGLVGARAGGPSPP